MATRTILGTKVQEGETFKYTAVVRDEDDATIDLTDSNVDVFLTYYNADAGTAINSRNNQQVVTAGVASNNHTVDASGNLTWKGTTADAPTVSADTTVVARYQIDFNDGAAVARTAIHEVQFTVENLATVT